MLKLKSILLDYVAPRARGLTALGLMLLSLAHAQLPSSLEPTTLENVLDLPGEGSYVELPARLFTNNVVTVEGWVKWREFGVYSRFFQFADSALNIVVMNYATTSTLRFERFRGPAFDGLISNDVPDLLKTNQ